MATISANVSQNYGRLELLIDGRWKTSSSEQIQQVFDPGSGRAIAEVPFATSEEVSGAIQSSQAAFQEKWSKISILERVKYLFKMRSTLEDHFEELSTINTQNHGKTLEESRGELKRTIENVDAAIAVAYTLSKGESMSEIAQGIDVELSKEPLGIFAIVCPFNFPLMVPFWFIPFAIVLGDTIVLKPSEIDPVPTAFAIKLIQNEAKLPPGVINIVHGGKEVVEGLISNKDVKGVTFVGSTPVARRIYKLAGEFGKRALSNGGAKNTIVVMPDASAEKSVPPIVSSFFGNAGQRCLAGANLITVGNETHDRVVDGFMHASRELHVGYGLDPSTEMGPVISQKAKERIMRYVEKGVSEDAKLVADGRKVRIESYPDGYYIGPSILDGVVPDMTIAREEIFGPVASVMKFDDLDHAIEAINRGTEFGNMACIFTQSGSVARKFKREVNAGNIGINLGVAQPSGYFPFGGRKESFYGVLHAQIDTVDFFTDKKITISRW